MPRKVDTPLVWLEGEVKTPPFSEAARIEAWAFRTRDRCPWSGPAAMSYGYRTVSTRGESCITWR